MSVTQNLMTAQELLERRTSAAVSCSAENCE